MYRVTQVATGVGGSPYYLTGYFSAAGGTAQQAADAWRNFLAPSSTGYMTGLTFSPITDVTLVDPVTGNTTGTSPVTVSSMACIGGTSDLPHSTQGLIRFRTGQYINGHEIRGRINIPCQLESDNTLGVPDTAWLSTWNTRGAALITGGTKVHAVYSPKNGCWATTTAAQAWNQWAILRSRRD